MSTKQELEQEGYAEADICAVSLCVVTLIPVGNAIVITYGEPYGLHCIQSYATADCDVERFQVAVIIVYCKAAYFALGRKSIIKCRSCEEECLEISCVEYVYFCKYRNSKGMVCSFSLPEKKVLLTTGINIPETGNYCESIAEIQVSCCLNIASVQSIAVAVRFESRVDETAANTKFLC